jgi:hypothetical protein
MTSSHASGSGENAPTVENIIAIEGDFMVELLMAA